MVDTVSILLAGSCGTLECLFQHEHVRREMKYVCVTCRFPNLRIQVQRLEDHIEIVFLWGSRYPMLCCELNLLESADTI